jgi:hypothetical protein
VNVVTLGRLVCTISKQWQQCMMHEAAVTHTHNTLHYIPCYNTPTRLLSSKY